MAEAAALLASGLERARAFPVERAEIKREELLLAQIAGDERRARNLRDELAVLYRELGAAPRLAALGN